MIQKRTTMMLALLIITQIVLFAGVASAQDEATATQQESQNKIFLILGCAIAVLIAGMSAAIGLTLSGSAAVAVTAEKPEVFGKLLVISVLPMTQAVYGLLTAILLMLGAGLLGGQPRTDMANPVIGPAAIIIGIIVGITGISAVNQGIVASSSISAVGRNPDIAARGIIFTVQTETIAIFGLLTGILLMTGLHLL